MRVRLLLQALHDHAAATTLSEHTLATLIHLSAIAYGAGGDLAVDPAQLARPADLRLQVRLAPVPGREQCWHLPLGGSHVPAHCCAATMAVWVHSSLVGDGDALHDMNFMKENKKEAQMEALLGLPAGVRGFLTGAALPGRLHNEHLVSMSTSVSTARPRGLLTWRSYPDAAVSSSARLTPQQQVCWR